MSKNKTEIVIMKLVELLSDYKVGYEDYKDGHKALVKRNSDLNAEISELKNSVAYYKDDVENGIQYLKDENKKSIENQKKLWDECEDAKKETIEARKTGGAWFAKCEELRLELSEVDYMYQYKEALLCIREDLKAEHHADRIGIDQILIKVGI